MIRRKNAHDGESPAVLWWVRDWLTSRTVLSMPRAARSLYFDLLMRQWLDGSLPADTRVIASLSGETHGAFLKLWQHVGPCFPAGSDGLLRNGRLERERKLDEEYRSAKSDAGKNGAAKRWHTHGTAIDPPLADGCPSPSPSPASTSPSGKPARAEPTGPQAECAEHFRFEWARTRPGTKAGKLKVADYVALAWMLENEPPDNVRRRITAMLDDREEFVVKNASLGYLRAKWDSYALAAAKALKPIAKEPPDAEDVRSRWMILQGRRVRDGKQRGVPDYPGYDQAKRELDERDKGAA